MAANNREISMEWWDDLPNSEKQAYSDHYNMVINNYGLRFWGYMTGREIEAIYMEYKNIKNHIMPLTDKEKDLIENYRNGARPIWWSVEDFETRAKEIEEEEGTENMFDRSRFTGALETVIQNHDSNSGITWKDIEKALFSDCQNI